MADLLPTVLPSFISLVGGFALGWLSHQLSGKRDRSNREYDARKAREARKIAFLKFMAQWQYEIEHTPSSLTVVAEYRAKLHLFRAESAAIDDDFTRERWQQFFPLCMALQDVDTDGTPDDTRDDISKALEAVVRFVESTQVGD